MLKLKSIILIFCLLLSFIFLTGHYRLILDDLHKDLQEQRGKLFYLPRTKFLKLLTFGFDAPVADALYIYSLIYFSNNNIDTTPRTTDLVNNKEGSLGSTTKQAFSSSRYTEEELADINNQHIFDLFNVITDLSPRFSTAYTSGYMLLSAGDSKKQIYLACDLLKKGIAYYSDFTKHNIAPSNNRLWYLHLLLAITYDSTIQRHNIRDNDLPGALEARQKALAEYKAAAASPNSPTYIQKVAAGYERSLVSTKGLEEVAESMVLFWRENLKNVENLGDKSLIKNAQEQLKEAEIYEAALKATIYLEKELSLADKKFMEKYQRPAYNLEELVERNYIPGIPILPFNEFQKATDSDASIELDKWLILPDGNVKSRYLSYVSASLHISSLLEEIIKYKNVTGNFPVVLEDLVAEGYLKAIPTPPLESMGQRYYYYPEKGYVEAQLPYTVPLPPVNQIK